MAQNAHPATPDSAAEGIPADQSNTATYDQFNASEFSGDGFSGDGFSGQGDFFALAPQEAPPQQAPQQAPQPSLPDPQQGQPQQGPSQQGPQNPEDSLFVDPFGGLFGVPVEDPLGSGTPQQAPQQAAPQAPAQEAAPEAPATDPQIAAMQQQIAALTQALTQVVGGQPVTSDPAAGSASGPVRDEHGRFAPREATPQAEAPPEIPELPKRPENYSRWEAQNNPESESAKYDKQVLDYDDAIRQRQRYDVLQTERQRQQREVAAQQRQLRDNLARQASQKYGIPVEDAGGFLDFIANPDTLNNMDVWYAAYQIANGKTPQPRAQQPTGQPAQQAPAQQAPAQQQQGPPQQAPTQGLFDGIPIQQRQQSNTFPATVAAQNAGGSEPPVPFERQVVAAANQLLNMENQF